MPEKTLGALDRILLGFRNRHLFAVDLLIFGVTPVVAVWLRTDGLGNLSGWDYVIRFAEPLAVYALVAA